MKTILYTATKQHAKGCDCSKCKPKGQVLIIDSHCHAGSGGGFQGPWNARASLKKYLPWAKEAGIDKTVIFSTFHHDYSLANAQVHAITRQHPGRLYGFAFINARRDAGKVKKMVHTAVHRYGFLGLKLHRHDAPISREVCDVAREYRLPVLYDVMGKVETVGLFAKEYPDVNFIIPHLGSFADNWKVQVHCITYLERYKNVYTDTSGIKRFDILQEAVGRAGADKFLFGSDGPWLHPGVELEKVFALTLEPAEERKILSGNFLRLAGIRKGNGELERGRAVKVV